jgi:competence protein ComEC
VTEDGRMPGGRPGSAWVGGDRSGRLPRTRLLASLLLLVLTLIAPACAELELLTEGSGGGPAPPPSGSLSVGFIDVGQGDGVLVQAGGESYLIDAGRPEEGPNVVDS